MFNFNITSMETKNLTLSQFKGQISNCNANHTPHLLDYMGEYDTTHANHLYHIDNPLLFWLYTFNNYQDLYQNILLNLDALDLTEGADDTFFDYNPANLETILYGLYQCQQEFSITQAIQSLIKIFEHYWDARLNHQLEISDLDAHYTDMLSLIDTQNNKITSIESLYFTSLTFSNK